MSYGVMTDYEYTATHKRERITVWSPPFASVFEAEGYARPGSSRYHLTTYNGDRVTVQLPRGITAPRTDENFHEIDRAISEHLSAHYQKIGATVLIKA